MHFKILINFIVITIIIAIITNKMPKQELIFFIKL